MLTRRNFIASSASNLICAPAIVHAANIMRVRGVIIPPRPLPLNCPTGELHFGFCDRLFVSLHLLKITKLQNEGLSLRQIADKLNSSGPKPWIDGPWDLKFVTSVLKRDEQIKRADAYFRMKRQLIL